ncbi:hypothetical protein BH20ACT8_BH20ACT8_15080 [soil metagenome]
MRFLRLLVPLLAVLAVLATVTSAARPAAAPAAPPDDLVTVAHRGSSGAAPENTLAAVKLAIDQGGPGTRSTSSAPATAR